MDRFLGAKKNKDDVSILHVFCDASLFGYAATAYLQFCTIDGVPYDSSFIASKSKVSPSNTKLTIPRLELLACHLATKLYKALKSLVVFDNVMFWSDSKTVLAWLRINPNKLQEFVGNRVAFVLQESSILDWNHVSGNANPSDIASRGCYPDEFNFNLFLKPSILGENLLKTKTMDNTLDVKTVDVQAEIKRKFTTIGLSTQNVRTLQSLDPFNPSKQNTLHRLLVRTATWKRLLNKFKGVPFNKGKISNVEKHDAFLLHVKLTQESMFKDEFKALSNGEDLKSSRIAMLRPFLDSNGIIRVGGRLQNAQGVNFDSINPVLLPACDLSKLVLQEIHETNLHCTAKTVMGLAKEKAWIINLNRLVRIVMRECLVCKKFISKNLKPFMADLPQDRVNASELLPFANCFVDFLQHIWIKEAGPGRTKRAYIAVFGCQQTRAVHLEPVSGLSMDKFLLALRRFLARRGTPYKIKSDNAKQFKATAKYLSQVFDKAGIKKLKNFASDFGIDWTFSVPYASSQNGTIESLVKRVRYHVRRIVGSKKLNFEELATLCYEFESIINMRPLCQNTDDPGVSALTPADLLMIRPRKRLPEVHYSENESNSENFKTLPQRRKLIDTIRKHFLNRFKKEFLLDLQVRHKNFLKERSLCRGDFVILNPPPNILPDGQFQYATIKDIYPGPDGVVRSVKLHTNNGEFEYPVNKLILLEESQDLL